MNRTTAKIATKTRSKDARMCEMRNEIQFTKPDLTYGIQLSGCRTQYAFISFRWSWFFFSSLYFFFIFLLRYPLRTFCLCLAFGVPLTWHFARLVGHKGVFITISTGVEGIILPVCVFNSIKKYVKKVAPNRCICNTY